MNRNFVEHRSHDRSLRVRQLLSQIGLSCNRETYRTLSLMVEGALKSNRVDVHMRSLYAYTAEQSGKSLSSVTRAISRAMDDLWINGDRNELADLFGKPLTSRPRPRDLVVCLRDFILAEEARERSP